MNSIYEALKTFLQSAIPNPNYRVAVVALFLVIVGLVWLILIPRLRHQRANFVLGIVLVALLLMVLAVAIPRRWQWVVGLLPTLMVGYQLFYLWLYHPKETETTAGAPTLGYTTELTELSVKRAQESVDSHFSLRTLFTRYGLPAVLLGITGIVVIDLMVDPTTFFSVVNYIDNPEISKILLRGIRLGAVGAYVYVLLELGRRTFRHDVTGAVAMWCWVTLVLGPVLAAAVAFLWRVQEPPGTTGWWGTGIVLFFTGFAPRRVVAAIEQAAAALLKVGPTAVVQTRLVPLTQIRGIDAQIEERLGEEGIFDVHGLASAEPVRLVRNTSFDMRQILVWIDEAILIVTLPRGWQALEEEGITGAIDLAWYLDKMVDKNTGLLLPVLPAEIIDLANLAKISPVSLADTIQRLNQDTQVQYIWALYNNFTEYSGGDSRDTNGYRPESKSDAGKNVNGETGAN